MATLREQMQRDLQLRGLSPKTQRAYLDKARDFARYFKQAPDQLGEDKIREYLHYLLAEKKGRQFHPLIWLLQRVLCNMK